MIEDVCEPPRDRRGPVPHRSALARRVRARLQPPAGHLAGRRAERDRARALGHRRQVGRAAGARPARRPVAGSAARLHLPVPRARRSRGRLQRSRSRRRACRGVRRPRLHRAQVRSCRALRDERSAPALGRGARTLRALRPSRCARRSGRKLRSAVRDTRSVHGGRVDQARAPARAVRPALARGADSARGSRGDGSSRACDDRFPSRPASG